MPSNIELKLRVPSYELLKQAIVTLTGQQEPTQTLRQVDTFFGSAHGRLKLRVENDSVREFGDHRHLTSFQDSGYLIQYNREDKADAKLSDFRTSHVSCQKSMLEVLSRAYGTSGVVNKTRLLWIYGQTRIHLDTVLGLGTFLELEVMMKPEQTIPEGEKIAGDILNHLGATDFEKIEVAYVDLLRFD